MMKLLRLSGLLGHALLRYRSSRERQATSPETNEAWQRGFRKLAALSEVPPGTARLYETGGTQVLIVNEAGEVHVIDATPLASQVPAGETIEALFENSEEEGDTVRTFDVLIEKDWIWADIDSLPVGG